MKISCESAVKQLRQKLGQETGTENWDREIGQPIPKGTERIDLKFKLF